MAKSCTNCIVKDSRVCGICKEQPYNINTPFLHSNWVGKTTEENKMPEENCDTCGNAGNCKEECSTYWDESTAIFRPSAWTPKPTENNKGINPKDALGAAKNPHGCVSRAVLAEVGLAMMEGARKYGRHNYRVTPVRAEVYFSACNRHLDLWWEGGDIDPDSGLPHLVKAIACLFVIRDAIIQDSWYDDRPPKTPPKHWEFIKKCVAGILEKYPESKPPYTEKDHGRGAINTDLSRYCPECRGRILDAKPGDAVPICKECM